MAEKTTEERLAKIEADISHIRDNLTELKGSISLAGSITGAIIFIIVLVLIYYSLFA